MTPTLLSSPASAAVVTARRPADLQTRDAAATPAARIDTARSSANAAVFSGDAAAIEAWARRASFASGFGGGLAEDVQSTPVPTAIPRPPVARLRMTMQRAVERLRDWLTAVGAAMRARETARQLAELDDRQLRDIGLSRSEILSAALESERAVAEHTARVHTQRVA